MSTELTKDNLLDRMMAYYLKDAPLTDKELEIAARTELAFALLQKHLNKAYAAKQLIAITKRKGGDLSRAQAYRDLSNAEKVFVPIQANSKEFIRHFVVQSCIDELKEIKRRLNNCSDKDYIKLNAQKNKTEYRLMHAAGVDADDLDLPDFSQINPKPVKINMPEEFMEVIQKALKGGLVDVTDFINNNAQDAEIIE